MSSTARPQTPDNLITVIDYSHPPIIHAPIPKQSESPSMLDTSLESDPIELQINQLIQSTSPDPQTSHYQRLLSQALVSINHYKLNYEISKLSKNPRVPFNEKSPVELKSPFRPTMDETHKDEETIEDFTLEICAKRFDSEDMILKESSQSEQPKLIRRRSSFLEKQKNKRLMKAFDYETDSRHEDLERQ
ncbi:hypothetical protein WICMUC_000958 [Wickerhamomyces mucosus]|uniref:Uncharacterized protein n=1 Tax=Wickerhamomyces mucosus TaxID=1378264 RepID=A0A9P8PW16_9ASCO|nr:hypothetical protein WICMUC_000958 [Wickerhamomyces mucosus]